MMTLRIKIHSDDRTNTQELRASVQKLAPSDRRCARSDSDLLTLQAYLGESPVGVPYRKELQGTPTPERRAALATSMMEWGHSVEAVCGFNPAVVFLAEGADQSRWTVPEVPTRDPFPFDLDVED